MGEEGGGGEGDGRGREGGVGGEPMYTVTPHLLGRACPRDGTSSSGGFWWGCWRWPLHFNL